MAEGGGAAGAAGGGGGEGAAVLPPLNILLRTKPGAHMVRLVSGGEGGVSLVRDEGPLGEPTPGIDLTEFSEDGALVALFSSASRQLRVVNVSSGDTVCTIEGHAVQAVSFSPLCTYLLTWERPAPPKPGAGPEPNLLVWSLAGGGGLVCGFPQRTFRKLEWPNLQWTKDEALAFKSTANEIQVLTGSSPQDPPVARIPAQGLGSFRLSPAARPVRLACFFPEAKGKAAGVRVLQYPEVRTPLAAKSFYKAQEAHMRWSPNGSAVLVHTHTDVDTSGVSYYGSTGLYLLNADAGIDATVPLPKEGAIADAQWAPAGPAQFIVIAGRMPAAATLYNAKAEPIFEFGEAHRNSISWSPHGRFVCLAGFGNLAGDMDFWDRNKLKRMGSNSSHCAVGHGWSPCGRFFMTATMAPRMNVDNAVKIFRYHGAGPVAVMDFEGPSLLAADFRPAAPGVFPDRPQSPLKKGATAEGEEAASLPPPPAPKPKAVYRPPNSTGALAAMLRAEREASTGPRRVGPGGGGAYVAPGSSGGQAYVPVGLVPAQQSKTAAKNKARKEKKKAAKEAAATTGGASAQDDDEEQAGGSSSRQTPPPPTATEGGDDGAAQQQLDPEKRAKAIAKKLKQIEDLKKRASGGEKLNEDQAAKLQQEDGLRQELAALKL